MSELEQNLTEENDTLKEKVATLEERLRFFEKAMFGKKSERIIDLVDHPELDLDIAAADPADIQTEQITYERQKPKDRKKIERFSYPDDLPIEEHYVEPAPETRICEDTGKELTLIRIDHSDKLAISPQRFYIKRFMLPVYAYKDEPESGVISTQMPDLPIRNCRADVSVLSNVAEEKFIYHMPLYRLEEKFKNSGVMIQRATMCGWIRQLGDALEPIYQEMFKRVMSNRRLFTDATSLTYLTKGKESGKNSRKGYVYVYAGGSETLKDPPYLLYQFAKDKTSAHPMNILDQFSGLLHSDADQVYETTAQRADILWQPCLAHARRKFIECAGPIRDEMIELFKDLFMNERDAWELSRSERETLRAEKQRPIIDRMYELIHQEQEKILPPKQNYTKALNYMSKRETHFRSFLEHPDPVIENNLSERAMKTLVIGRKNWMFLGSEDSGKSTMIILSIVQTCKHLGVDVQAYLEDVLSRIMSYNSQKVSELLPDEWAKSNAAE